MISDGNSHKDKLLFCINKIKDEIKKCESAQRLHTNLLNKGNDAPKLYSDAVLI